MLTVGRLVLHFTLAVAAVIGAADLLAVAREDVAGVGRLVGAGRAVALTEAGIDLSLGAHALIDAVVGVLAHLRAGDDRRHGGADTGAASDRQRGVRGEDLALIVRLHSDAARVDHASGVDNGLNRGQSHADQSRDGHAGRS